MRKSFVPTSHSVKKTFRVCYHWVFTEYVPPPCTPRLQELAMKAWTQGKGGDSNPPSRAVIVFLSFTAMLCTRRAEANHFSPSYSGRGFQYTWTYNYNLNGCSGYDKCSKSCAITCHYRTGDYQDGRCIPGDFWSTTKVPHWGCHHTNWFCYPYRPENACNLLSDAHGNFNCFDCLGKCNTNGDDYHMYPTAVNPTSKASYNTCLNCLDGYQMVKIQTTPARWRRGRPPHSLIIICTSLL